MNDKAPYPHAMREEELKNRVAKDWFSAFDCSRIIGNIDFCVDIPATELNLGYDAEPALWAEAKADCLVFALFHGQNRVSSADGVNHWIPFTEEEVGAKDCFKSHFMSDVLNGSGIQNPNPDNPVENNSAHSAPPRLCVKDHLSPAAASVLDAGRELWRYYHAQPNANPDASYYDIRLHFQGTKKTASGKLQMNPTSPDATYTSLLANLRAEMKLLARQIEPKVYEYGFLRM